MRLWPLVWVSSLVLAGGAGYFADRLVHGRASEAPVLVLVNESAITRQELQAALFLEDGARTLSELVDQKLVLQQAEKLGLRLAPGEEPQPPKAEPAVAHAYQQQLRCAKLLEKLLLRKVSEEDRRKVYRSFRKVLREYDLYCIVLTAESDYKLIQEDLEKKATFPDLVHSYSIDEKTRKKQGSLGYLAPSDMRKMFGEEALAAIPSLKPEQLSGPIPTPFGPTVFKYKAVRESYADLKPRIDGILMHASKAEFLEELRRSAAIKFVQPQSPQAPNANT